MIVDSSWNSYAVMMVMWVSLCGNYGAVNILEQLRLSLCKQKSSNVMGKRSVVVVLAAVIATISIFATSLVGFLSMMLKGPMDTPLNIELKWEYLSVAIVVSSVCSFFAVQCGCSHADSTKNDNVERFVRAASKLGSEAFGSTAVHLKSESLFKKLRYIYSGGALLGIGLTATYLILAASITSNCNIRLVVEVGILIPAWIASSVFGSLQLWIYFRVLFIYPESEIMRHGSFILLSGLNSAMFFVFGRSINFVASADDWAKITPGLFRKTTQNSVLTAVSFVTCIVMMVGVTNMRMWYQNLARIIKQADASHEHALAVGSPSSKANFIADYEELRSLEGTHSEISQFNKKRLSKQRDVVRRHSSPHFSGPENHTTGSPTYADHGYISPSQQTYYSPNVSNNSDTSKKHVPSEIDPASMSMRRPQSPSRLSPSKLFRENTPGGHSFGGGDRSIDYICEDPEKGFSASRGSEGRSYPDSFAGYAAATKQTIATTTSAETISTVDTGNSSSSRSSHRTYSSRSMRSISSRSEYSAGDGDEENLNDNVEASVVVKGSGSRASSWIGQLATTMSSPSKKSSSPGTASPTQKTFQRPKQFQASSAKLNTIRLNTITQDAEEDDPKW